ncbi:MAG: hypothetical protein JO139_11890 [Alphaproteobacteria bacterium]|nr:hypothetical protein [Alphaproteobacteria bacterium]
MTGTFLTGVLATIVARTLYRPVHGCGNRLCADRTGSVAIGIFLALGLGLAAPYLVATVIPAGSACCRSPAPG